jgi:hypothetical protein
MCIVLQIVVCDFVIIFFWLLCCLFFDLRNVITILVYSTSSYKSYKHHVHFSSVDKQLLYLWMINRAAGNQLTTLFVPATWGSIYLCKQYVECSLNGKVT